MRRNGDQLGRSSRKFSDSFLPTTLSDDANCVDDKTIQVILRRRNIGLTMNVQGKSVARSGINAMDVHVRVAPKLLFSALKESSSDWM